MTFVLFHLQPMKFSSPSFSTSSLFHLLFPPVSLCVLTSLLLPINCHISDPLFISLPLSTNSPATAPVFCFFFS